MTHPSTRHHDLQPAVSVLATALSVLDVHWDALPASRRRELIRAAHRRAEILLAQLRDDACPTLGGHRRRNPRPRSSLADHVQALAVQRCPTITVEADVPSRLLVELPDELLQTLLTTLVDNFRHTRTAPLRLRTRLVEGGRRVRLELQGPSMAEEPAGPSESLCLSVTEPDPAERAVIGRALRGWFERKFGVTVHAAGPSAEQPHLTLVLEMPTHATAGTSAS